MLKYIVPICCGLISVSTAQAQDCPDAFRFVDFGLPATDGTLYRGGPTYRVELDGARIFQPGTVACSDVGPISFDGHNNPIPVVKTFGYAPARVADHIRSLVVSRASPDSLKVAKTSADLHQSVRFAEGAAITKGANFLCAAPSDTSPVTLSCEVVNPFDTTASLIVSCDQTDCKTQAVPIGDEITIDATWVPSETLPSSKAGQDIAETITTIHAFFDDKTAQ